MAGGPQRGPHINAGQDKPVLFDHPYWQDRGLWSPLLVLVATIVVFAAMFAAVFYSLAHEGLPSTDETRRAAILVISIGAGLCVFTLWPLYGILGRITIDEEGITYRNIGKRVRIRFDEVTFSKRKWSGAIRIESQGQRITCPGTRGFSACERFLTERLEGLGRQDAMAEPWNADPAMLEKFGDNHEFRPPRFLAVGSLVMALIFLVCAVAFAHLEDDLVGAVVFVALAAAGWLSWYILSVRVRLDKHGITQSRPGKQIRIEFDAVESARSKRFFSKEEIVLQSRDKRIHIGRDYEHTELLYHMLFARVPELSALEQVELPHTVRTPRYLYAGCGAAAAFCVGCGIFFWFIGYDASLALRLALPIMMTGCGLSFIVTTLSAATGITLRANALDVHHLRKTRTFPLDSLTAVRSEQGGRVRLMFGKTKVSFLPDMPSFLMLRILRNVYAEQLREAAEGEGRP